LRRCGKKKELCLLKKALYGKKVLTSLSSNELKEILPYVGEMKGRNDSVQVCYERWEKRLLINFISTDFNFR